MRLEHALRDEARERCAERHADDRERDRDRPQPPWHVLRAQRARVRQRAAESEAREETQDRERRDIPRIRGGSGENAKHRKASDERPPAAESVPEEAKEDLSARHAHEAERRDPLEGRAIDLPVLHERGDRDAQRLDVDAVENDREGGECDDEDLVAAPPPLVEHPADVDRRAGMAHDFNAAVSIGSVRTRLPVAEKIALTSAGMTGGNAGSPRPVGAAVLRMKWTSTGGA